MRTLSRFVAILVACSVQLVWAVPLDASTAVAPPTLIKLISETVAASTVAAPKVPGVPSGETPESRILVRDRLYNGVRQFGRARHALVGSDTETELRYHSGRRWISVTAKLPRGTIYVRGNSRNVGAVVVVAVTGGAGRFAGVHGTVSVFNLPGSNGLAANVYRLSR